MDPYTFQLVALVLCPLLALGLPAPRRRLLRLPNWLSPAVVITLTTIAGGVIPAALCWRQWPTPQVHDEFSYLLAADTFAHGRLANPPLPHWEHFESFHVLQQPTYASKYPPAQGLFMALGQRLFGHPLTGVWLSTALAAGALSWMLYGWLPRDGAALCSLLCLHPLLFEWGQSYWGGAVAAAGSALVYGGLPRLLRSPGVLPSAVMAVGAALLANSRPWEGLLVCLPAAAAVGISLLQGESRWRRAAYSLGPPAVLLSLVFAWMLHYNRQVTGDALTHPHRLHYEQYCVSPIFLFQSPHDPPPARHAEIARFHRELTYGFYQYAAEPSQFAKSLLTKPFRLLLNYTGLLLGVSLAALPCVLRRRLYWAPAAAGLLLVASYNLQTFAQVHYMSPLLAPALLLATASLRVLRVWQRRRRLGAKLAALLLLGAIGANLLSSLVRPEVKSFAHNRELIQQALLDEGGRHLIFVDYPPGYDPHHEWVYNGADLNESPVVWARSMGPPRDVRLMHVWPDRTIWLLRPGRGDDTPKPYAAAMRNEAQDG